jgi:hypothetical protein
LLNSNSRDLRVSKLYMVCRLLDIKFCEYRNTDGRFLCCEGELINPLAERKGFVDQASMRWLGHER